jgi:hypothetical protein
MTRKQSETDKVTNSPDSHSKLTGIDGRGSELNWNYVAESVLVAQVLVDQYGAEAPLKAEASASRLLLDWADLEAWAYWKRAGRAAEQLLLTEPTGTIH